MSMPIIPAPVVTEETALANVIASIALEEAALAHIINAEGEKIQRVVGTFVAEEGQPPLPAPAGVDVESMTAINDSVGEMMGTITRIESALHNKLRTVLSVLE